MAMCRWMSPSGMWSMGSQRIRCCGHSPRCLTSRPSWRACYTSSMLARPPCWSSWRQSARYFHGKPDMPYIHLHASRALVSAQDICLRLGRILVQLTSMLTRSELPQMT